MTQEIRKNLLHMKSLNEGIRALTLWVGMQFDIIKNSEDDKILKTLINKHFEETGSPLAKKMLGDWLKVITKFKKVTPRDYEKALEKLNKKHEILIN